MIGAPLVFTEVRSSLEGLHTPIENLALYPNPTSDDKKTKMHQINDTMAQTYSKTMCKSLKTTRTLAIVGTCTSLEKLRGSEICLTKIVSAVHLGLEIDCSSDFAFIFSQSRVLREIGQAQVRSIKILSVHHYRGIRAGASLL